MNKHHLQIIILKLFLSWLVERRQKSVGHISKGSSRWESNSGYHRKHWDAFFPAKEQRNTDSQSRPFEFTIKMASSFAVDANTVVIFVVLRVKTLSSDLWIYVMIIHCKHL